MSFLNKQYFVFTLIQFLENLVKKRNWRTNGIPKYGVFATKNDQWASYNDIKTVRYKANYILKNNYAGAALYFMDNDDFNNECCHGRYPLLNSIGNILRGVGKLTEGNCKKPPSFTTPAPPEVTTGKYYSYSM